MTDLEQCPSPTYHQRHRWTDGPNEVKCPGRERPTSTTASDLPFDLEGLDEKRKAEHIARCGAVFGPLRKLICRMGHPL